MSAQLSLPEAWNLDTVRRERVHVPEHIPMQTKHDVALMLIDRARQWQRVTWREGSRGAMCKEFAAARMHWGIGTAARTLDDQRVSTGAEGWLVAERLLPEEEEDYRYYFSNLPRETPLEYLAAVVRGRWPIEQFYEEAKQECGLGDYQGRRWDGVHRHLALVMLAYSFLVLQRLQTEQSPPKSEISALSRLSLPAIHRNIQLWLLQDLVLWWIATDHIKTFRSWRSEYG